MRIRIKQNLKRVLSICVILVLLFSTIGSHGTIAYAAESDFEEVTLTLCSSVVDDDTIELYLFESLHYISIDDLCRLTRSTKTVDGNTFSVTQGIWRAEFDVVKQTFYDGCQTVAIPVLEISKDKYAVPALMFLNYYKAIAWVENDVLYCEMPNSTAWETLDLDYSNSLVDIYDLYGGERNVELSLIFDILMDFIMGNNPTTEKYLKSAYYEALDVDIYSYDAVEQYVNERNEKVYNDLVAEETQSLLESLSSICETGDTTNKIAQEAMDLYILFHCTGQTREFYNLAYNAMELGDATSMRHYADQIASVWREGEFQKSLVKNNAKSVEGTFFLLSSAVEAAQQVKYVHQENNLVYRVMGQENMKKLSLDVEDNEWYEVANVYKSTTTSLQNSFVNILEDLQTRAINDLVSEAAGKIGVDTFLESAASKATGIKGIESASWKIGLEVGRGAVNLFSWIDSLAEPNSLADILLTDVGAYEADRLSLYLSELQQNVYWVLCHEYEWLCNNRGDVNAYQDYIFAQQLYCRTSIAMYENLIAMNDEFGGNKDYWRSLFQNRIDMLAVSLYQLTTLQDDGINACLPLELYSFCCKVTDNSIVYELREEIIEYRLSDGTLYYSNTIQYPYFLGSTDAEININNKYAAIIEKYKNNTTDFDALYQEELEWNPEGIHGLPYYDNITAEVTYCMNGAISIKECATMWSGGVHSYSDYSGYTYYVAEGSEIPLSEILIGPDEQINDLIDRYKKGIIDYYNAKTILASPFVLTEEGICFICNVGDAVPRVEVLIPYSDADTFVITTNDSLENIDNSQEFIFSKDDLSQYIKTDIAAFSSMFTDLSVDQYSDGTKMYSNSYLNFDEDHEGKIYSISIKAQCNYTICGLKYGMMFDEACDILQKGDYIIWENREGYLMVEGNGFYLSISAFYSEGQDLKIGNNVSSISIRSK